MSFVIKHLISAGKRLPLGNQAPNIPNAVLIVLFTDWRVRPSSHQSVASPIFPTYIKVDGSLTSKRYSWIVPLVTAYIRRS